MKGSFQIIVIVIFIFAAIFGVLVFSGAIPIGTNNSPGALGTVTLWGTVPQRALTAILEEFNNVNTSFALKYIQKSEDTFDQDLLEALAGGVGPDMVLLPDDLVFQYSNKIFAIPYNSYSLALFKNNFASAGEVFLSSRGVLAFPLSIDPLVMYYNRSMLDTAGVIAPPASWDDLVGLIPKFTVKDDSSKITKSTIALGHFSNVVHAKDILATLFMQAGNFILSEKDGILASTLGNPSNKYNLSSILKFYTDFADPNKPVYSWNKSFPNSRDAFSSESLAFYFGFASELISLVNKNPNQNFAVAPMPQIKNSNFKLTGARVLGVAILSSSKNLNTAFTAANLLSSSDFASRFVSVTGVAPALRSLLAKKPVDAFSPIFYNSALFARSWIDPSPSGTDAIFRNMIEGVISNKMTTEAAISDANGRLNLLLYK